VDRLAAGDFRFEKAELSSSGAKSRDFARYRRILDGLEFEPEESRDHEDYLGT